MPLWIPLLSFLIGLLVGLVFILFEKGFLIDRYKKITQTLIEGVLWEWEWDEKGYVNINSLKPLCPQCKTKLKLTRYHGKLKRTLHCRSVSNCSIDQVSEFEVSLGKKEFDVKEIIDGKVRRKEL